MRTLDNEQEVQEEGPQQRRRLPSRVVSVATPLSPKPWRARYCCHAAREAVGVPACLGELVDGSTTVSFSMAMERLTRPSRTAV